MAHLAIGDVVFERRVPGATRGAIAMFSEATEDPNPIHVDDDFAKACGFPQVIQQGPMTTAHFARILAETLGAPRLRVLDITFTAPVFPEEALLLSGKIAKIDDAITIDLVAAKTDGTVTARGYAVVSIP